MTRPKDGLNRRTFTKAASLTVATGFFSRSVDAAQPYTRPRKKGRTGLDYMGFVGLWMVQSRVG